MTTTGWFRLAMYVGGLLASLLIAGRLLPLHRRLSRALAALALAWAVNAAVLASLLLNRAITHAPFPSWQDPTLTVLSVLLFIAPAVVWFYLGNPNGNEEEK